MYSRESPELAIDSRSRHPSNPQSHNRNPIRQHRMPAACPPRSTLNLGLDSGAPHSFPRLRGTYATSRRSLRPIRSTRIVRACRSSPRNLHFPRGQETQNSPPKSFWHSWTLAGGAHPTLMPPRPTAMAHTGRRTYTTIHPPGTMRGLHR